MDPSKYKALQDEKAKILAESKATFDNPQATAEQIAAATAAVNDRLPQVEAQLAAIERLHKEEETATARAKSAIGVQVTAGFEKDPMRGFRSVGEFAQKVRLASDPSRPGFVLDPRLAALQAAPVDPLKHGGDVGEGYLVPPEVTSAIWKAIYGGEGILARMNPRPTASNFVEFIKDETTPWGAGGVKAYWLDSGVQITRSKSGHKKVMLKLHRLAALVEATDELLEDAPRLTSLLQESAPDAINYEAEAAIIAGDGVGKPRGFAYTGGPLVSVAKKTGQTADTLVAHNFGAMWAQSLDPANSFFIGSKTTMPSLLELNVGNQPAFIPANRGMVGAPTPATVLGLPYVFSRHGEAVGDVGDVYMVDPNGYMCAVKSGGTKFDASIHLYFDYAVTAFRWIFRIGGEPILSAAIAGPKGINESHFLAVAARA